MSSKQVGRAGGKGEESRQDSVGFGGQWGYYTVQNTASLDPMTPPAPRNPCTLNGLRYYDPSVGRFITRDPIGYDGGINLYAFCGNNPVMGADPTGLDKILLVFGDQHGVFGARAANWWYRPKDWPGQHNTFVRLDSPTVKQFIDAAKDADVIYVWSHGGRRVGAQ